MKRYLIVIVLLITTVVGAWAKGPQGVSGSKHDFSSSNLVPSFWYTASNENEVCIFCHTPHGGVLNTQLWNRNLPTATFTHYNSATLTALGVAATRPVNQESLLCLSCHDGTVAMNSLLNYSNVTVGVPNNGSPVVPKFGFMPSAVIGEAFNALGGGVYEGFTFLSDDHPISFSYYNVREYSPENQLKLRETSLAETRGVRFFPANVVVAGADGKRVECSSCHDPHVDVNADPTYAPFLITPNTGSALCLACHIK